MKKLLAISLASVMVLGAASYVFAGANPNVQFAIDCQARNNKRACTPLYTSCSGITQEYHAIGFTDAIVVVYMYTVISAAEYGVTWCADAYFTEFKNCADFIVGGVELPTDWISCAQSWSALQYATSPDPGTSGIGVGWLKLYTYGPCRVDFVPSDQGFIQVLDDLLIADQYHTIHPGLLGSAVPEPGDLDPCEMGPTATESSTWGNVKSLYR
jgi:hypothetical protein